MTMPPKGFPEPAPLRPAKPAGTTESPAAPAAAAPQTNQPSGQPSTNNPPPSKPEQKPSEPAPVPEIAFPQDVAAPQAPADKPREGFDPIKTPSFRVRMVGKDFSRYEGLVSFGAAALFVFVLFMCLFKLMGIRWHSLGQPHVSVPFSIAITWILAMAFNSCFWTSGEALRRRPFTNHLLPKTIDVFGAEFAIKHWWQSSFKSLPEVDLQKDETIKDSVTLTTKDGRQVQVEFETLRRVVENGLYAFLGFSPGIVDYRVKLVIIDRLQQVFGLNSWETISKYRGELMEWVSEIFGDDEEQSPFEKHFGILVYNPKLLKIELIGKGSETIAQAQAKAQKFSQVVQDLRRDLPFLRDDKELSKLACRMLDIELTETKNVVDAPKGVHTVALGADIITPKGGKKGK